jgi:hypothetical protein
VTAKRRTGRDRIKMIYERYLTAKKEYLAANLKAKESNYRKTVGLKVRDTHARRYKRQQLKFRRRLNISTKTLVEGRPHWTDEEIDAALDYDEEMEQEAEGIEEGRWAAMGGRNTERGVQGVHNRIARHMEQEEAQYSFMYE